jgi:glycine/D-amino acid oxidase-like deaminating enzyme
MRFSGEDVTIGCNGRIVVADSVVLCTNGYLPPRTEACVPAVIRGNLRGVVGYMVGGEGGSGPEGARALFPGGDGYYYITRRKYRGSWLTAAGGPEGSIAGPYDPGTVYHPGAYERLESFLSSTLDGYTAPSPRRWQGLMGYTSTGTRIAGRDPGLPVLHYNLGCNGIGIMSAVAGAKRLEDLMAGRDLEPSMFDPEAVTGLRGNGRARERLP